VLHVYVRVVNVCVCACVGVDVVLGDVVLRGLYVIFHRELQQIGFAPQAQAPFGCGDEKQTKSGSFRPLCRVYESASTSSLDNPTLFYVSYALFASGGLACVVGGLIGVCAPACPVKTVEARSGVNGSARFRQRSVTHFSEMEMTEEVAPIQNELSPSMARIFPRM